MWVECTNISLYAQINIFWKLKEKKDLPTIKYDMFSVSGEDKKGHI